MGVMYKFVIAVTSVQVWSPFTVPFFLEKRNRPKRCFDYFEISVTRRHLFIWTCSCKHKFCIRGRDGGRKRERWSGLAGGLTADCAAAPPPWPARTGGTGRRGLRRGWWGSRRAGPEGSETAGGAASPCHTHTPTPPPPGAARSEQTEHISTNKC